MTLKCLVTISQHPSHEQEDSMVYVFHLRTDPGGLVVSNLPANEGDVGLIPGVRKIPEEGNGNPLQYSCWEISWTEEPGGLQSTGLQRVGQD